MDTIEIKIITKAIKESNQMDIKSALVLGGSGTIGHQLVSYLKGTGYWVRSVDVVLPKYSETKADEFMLGDLRNPDVAFSAMQINNHSFDLVFMLAAQMGGAEYIFTKENDADIIYDSALMNLNIANAASMYCTGKLFFSSSACAYSESLQMLNDSAALKESTAWVGKPDSIYGIEKLFSESMYDSFRRNKKLNVRIGRFHNIFSEECHFSDKRAKAPAAICFKVATAKDGDAIKILGDGLQKRSFLYINEAIDGVMRLMESDYYAPVNIGSEEIISINEFARMIIDISDKQISINNIESDVIGVRGRNSDNTLIQNVLGWKPSASLRSGIEKLYFWIDKQVNHA